MTFGPYMTWAKLHHRPTWSLAGSNLLPCTLDDLPGAREALEIGGDNDEGYRPLVEAIARRYGVSPGMVATAPGTSGANFLVFAALVRAGDEVLVEQPGYDPLMGAAALLGARVTGFERRFEDGYRLDPEAVRRGIIPRTKLVVVTNLHNPSGVLASDEDLDEIGRIAEAAGARVLVDEVYLDSARREGAVHAPAGARAPVFVTTSSLTKSYGLSGLRCGWVIASPETAERVRRARDVVDGSGPFPAERLSVLAFDRLDALAARARAILDAGRTLILDFLASRPEFAFVPPAGGTVVFPRLQDTDDATPFVERLARDHDTGIVPGSFFQSPAHVRIAFGGRRDVLEESEIDSIGERLNRGETQSERDLINRCPFNRCPFNRCPVQSVSVD
jgi:aspartate/methionine/tyrosine aminotransferase